MFQAPGPADYSIHGSQLLRAHGSVHSQGRRGEKEEGMMWLPPHPYARDSEVYGDSATQNQSLRAAGLGPGTISDGCWQKSHGFTRNQPPPSSCFFFPALSTVLTGDAGWPLLPSTTASRMQTGKEASVQFSCSVVSDSL